MLVCEASFVAATRKLAHGMRIKHPTWWSLYVDGAWIRHNLMPSYMESLQEIEGVELCAGFDLDMAYKMYIGKGVTDA